MSFGGNEGIRVGCSSVVVIVDIEVVVKSQAGLDIVDIVEVKQVLTFNV